MSSTASAQSFGEKQAQNNRNDQASDPALLIEKLAVELDDDLIVDLRDDVEPTEVVSEPLLDTCRDEVPEGIHDPVFPFVLLGTLALIIIVLLSATLAL